MLLGDAIGTATFVTDWDLRAVLLFIAFVNNILNCDASEEERLNLLEV